MTKNKQTVTRLLVVSKLGVSVSRGSVRIRCPSCRSDKPLSRFGARLMANGELRNQPWCSECRAAAKAGK